ncbi:ABC transporter substrate-binding protein [Nesterenkonia sp. NBAIMH1]|uniref:ABC transporter substrate-binding protein n=1 Tax=Nesterenkonia sp. NBAIMH1 TaxID=2600320 RepID=UPI0011B4DE43|nr:ABC transporter substrate-binding protein [Nesterenkonia sp. NBAIMH1]
MTEATHTPFISRRKRMASAGVSLLATGALVLAGCAQEESEADEASGEQSEDLTEVTVVTFLPLESLTFTPEMYAEAGGYFEEHGLDVTLEPVQGTPAAVQATIGGAGLMTRVDTTDVMPSMEDGQPLTAVGTMTYASSLRMVSSMENPIESAEDIEGLTIGMGSVGGTSETTLDLALQDADVPGDSVDRQATQVSAATLELVRQGTLNGYIASLDTAMSLDQQNDDMMIASAGLTDAPTQQTWVTASSALDDPESVEQIEAVLAAVQEAVNDVAADEENDFENVIEVLRGEYSFPALDDDEAAQAALEAYTNEIWVDPSGQVDRIENDLDGWSSIYEDYTTAGLVEGDGDPDTWITNDHVPGN